MAVPPHAVVTHGADRRVLRPGESLSFGRGRDADLRVAPEDLRVPRLAGRLECRTDGVLVHSTSAKVGLMVHPFPGTGFTVDPLAVVGSRPHGRLRVTVSGLSGEHALTVDTTGLGPAATTTPVAPTEGRATIGFDRIASLTSRQRRLLTALCLPILTRGGARAEVPGYAGVAKILGDHGAPLAMTTVRNALLELRSLLVNEHGIVGLDAPGEAFLRPLALWAVRSGNVTDDDLDGLDAGADG